MEIRRVVASKFVAGVVASLALLLAPSVAQAALIISFDDVIQVGGSVTGTNGANNADNVGAGILFDLITLSDSVSLVVYGSAQCGPATTAGGSTAAAACQLNFDTGTGVFAVTSPGGLYDAGADGLPYSADTGALIQGSGDVLRGTFDPGWFLSDVGFVGGGTDTKSQALLDFFGITVVGAFSFANTDITLIGTTVSNADIDNTGEITFVPEPGLLTMLGLGLLGVGRHVARRRRA